MAEETLEKLFDDYREDRDGVNQNQAYEILCIKAKFPTFLDIHQFWADIRKDDEAFTEKSLINFQQLEELYDKLGSGEFRLQQALDVFDGNGDGKLDRKEFGLMMKSIDNALSQDKMFDDEWIDQTLALADTNNDGFIDRDELAAMLRGGEPDSEQTQTPGGALLTVAHHDPTVVE